MPTFGSDREILDKAYQWLTDGHEVGLVTVLKTWGSSPRPVGSLLAMTRQGRHIGSVSGGCVEEDLFQRFSDNELSADFPTTVNYGVNRDDATRFGLPCGGRLELLVEKLDHSTPVKALLDRMDRGELVARRLCLTTGEVSLHPAGDATEFQYQDTYVQKIFGQAWSMLLVGAGHLAHYVARMALMMDYRVVICDPREEYQNSWSVDGVAFTTDMPDDAVAGLADHPRSIIITLSHDPKLDDMALMQALESQAFYVGALGSKRNNDKRRQRLLELGVKPEALARLHAPVGLAIGSHKPPEIAIAILGEITALRNGKHVSKK